MRTLPCHVYMLSYRGYGGNPGTPSEHGLKKDALAAYQDVLTLQRQFPELRDASVYVYGQSLGCAVALYLYRMHAENIAGCILENPFMSIAYMLKTFIRALPQLYWFRWFVTEEWDNMKEMDILYEKLGSDKLKVLLLTAARDEIIPADHSLNLFKFCLPRGQEKFQVEEEAFVDLAEDKENATHNNVAEELQDDIMEVEDDLVHCQVEEGQQWDLYLPQNDAYPQRMYLFKRGHHNDLWLNPGYFKAIKEFFSAL